VGFFPGVLDGRRVNGAKPDKDPKFKDFRQGRALVLQGFGATTMVRPMQVLSTYRFTVDEYHRLDEAGILGEDGRVELLNGDLITMAPIGEHRTVVDTLNLLFARLADNGRYRIGIQNPVSLNPHSEPNPTLLFVLQQCLEDTRVRRKSFFWSR
jgi:Uma2 family endonuclease